MYVWGPGVAVYTKTAGIYQTPVYTKTAVYTKPMYIPKPARYIPKLVYTGLRPVYTGPPRAVYTGLRPVYTASGGLYQSRPVYTKTGIYRSAESRPHLDQSSVYTGPRRYIPVLVYTKLRPVYTGCLGIYRPRLV